MVERLPLWRPLYDLAWAKVLLWVATAGKQCQLRPGVHAYLAGLYFTLADAFQVRGWIVTAKGMTDQGRLHELAGPPPEPPPLAMVMGIPQPPIVTEARGKPIARVPGKKREEDWSAAGSSVCWIDPS